MDSEIKQLRQQKITTVMLGKKNRGHRSPRTIMSRSVWPIGARMLSGSRNLPAGFIQPCLPTKRKAAVRRAVAARDQARWLPRHIDQTKAAAVSERAKCARLSSAHAHQGRGAGRPGCGPQQREGKPRLGSNGFRAWLARPAARYIRCDCEWAAHLAVHYRVEEDGS
jgi:hypothetical protein